MTFFRTMGIVALAILAIAFALVAPVAASPPSQPDVGVNHAAIATPISESANAYIGYVAEVMNPCVMSFGKLGLSPADLWDITAAEINFKNVKITTNMHGLAPASITTSMAAAGGYAKIKLIAPQPDTSMEETAIGAPAPRYPLKHPYMAATRDIWELRRSDGTDRAIGVVQPMTNKETTGVGVMRQTPITHAVG